MGSSFKTQGIVIKRTNLGEADRILTILTDRFGKIKAIAKGVRKTKSKLAGSLEPFMIIDFQLHEGKTFYIITGASIKNDLSNLHLDLKRISQIFYIGELIDKFIEEDHLNLSIFDLLKTALEQVEQSNDDFILRIFELKLIESSGFKPQLFEGVHCKTMLSPGDNFWDEIEGGVICASCQSKTKHGRKISDNAIKILRLIEKDNFDLVGRLNLEKKLKKELSDILSNYIKNILEKELCTEKFMKEFL